MVKNIFVAFCVCLSSHFLQAQVEYSQQYSNGKQLFRAGKYNLAMETFKPLIPYDQNNPFSEYASFYYALSAYYQGYRAVAKDQLKQIKTVHPKWDKMDDVNFWLGKIHLDDNNYFQALKILASIQDKKMQKDIEAIKTQSLSKVTDVETLKMMHEEYPKDNVVARALARELANDLADPVNKEQLEQLIKAFDFKRSEYFVEAPKTFKKDVYSVSVVMPFMVNSLEPTLGKKRNQMVLDFYEGMKMALDTLSKIGVNISLRAYDTERDTNRITVLLSKEELKKTDLIIGPLFPEENAAIQEFSLEHKVNVINPFFNNREFIDHNPFGFLFQPSVESMGKRSGEFLASYVEEKDCMVFYGANKRDSLLAANFIQTAQENGLNIVASHRIPKENVRQILEILATPTEYDEFKYPSEFTLKKDSIGSIFVASDDPLLYAKVVSGVETRGDSIVVLGSEVWLEHTVVDFEKYQTLPIVLAAPNFVRADDPQYIAFLKHYIKQHGRVPSYYARNGYELMLFAGTLLKDHGVFFQEGLNNQEFIPGFLYQGYNFKFSRNNQYVPFIRYEDGYMKAIDKP